MTTYDKWIDYVSGALVAFAAIASFLTGDVLSGLLFTSVLMYQIVNHVNKRQLAELRADIALALKREHEHIKRYARAEAQVAYHEYLRKQRRDAIVAEINEEYRIKSRETYSRLVENAAGDAE